MRDGARRRPGPQAPGLQCRHIRRLLGVRQVVPMHFGTFPILVGTPEQLRKEAADVAGLEVLDLEPGGTLE